MPVPQRGGNVSDDPTLPEASMPDSLSSTLTASHAMLRERIADTTHVSFPRQARDHQARADIFLMSACQHVSAVSNVLVVEISRVDSQLARQITRECHLLLLSMQHAKGRLYGSAQFARVSWHEVWDQVVERFENVAALERDAVEELATRMSPDGLDALAERLCRAEQRAPTRPHPFLPRRGVHGRVALAVASRADGIWDAFEGRCPPPTTAVVHA